MRRAEPKQPLKKLPKRKISFREAYISGKEGAYVQKVELTVTREISLGKGQRSSLQGTRPQRFLQSTAGGKKLQPQYIKSRSKSQGRVGARANSPPLHQLQPQRRTKTPSKADRASRSKEQSKGKSGILIREESTQPKKHRSKSKSSKGGLNISSKSQLKTADLKSNPILKKQQKKPTEQLRKKCANLIHNRYVLEKKLQERVWAAIKIQSWVRGHQTRNKLQRQYQNLVMQESLYAISSQQNEKAKTGMVLPVNQAWMTKWIQLSQIYKARNLISDRINRQNFSCEPTKQTVSTNWHSVHKYIRAIKTQIKLRYSVLFERCLKQPFGLSPVQRLRLLSGDSQTDRGDEEPLVLPDELFETIQARLNPNGLEISHHQAIFDCYIQSMSLLRPYFSRLGQPYPWVVMFHQPYLSQKQAFKTIDSLLQKSCGMLCGLIIDHQQFDHLQELVQHKRQQLLQRYIQDWIGETDDSWLRMQDERTELLLQVSTYVALQLVGQFAKQLLNIRYIRNFL